MEKGEIEGGGNYRKFNSSLFRKWRCLPKRFWEQLLS